MTTEQHHWSQPKVRQLSIKTLVQLPDANFGLLKQAVILNQSVPDLSEWKGVT